jgi:Holliday junction resolvase RusA-like endonuclease
VRSQIDPDKAELFEWPVRITISCWFKNKPQDADNICTKPYIDGLIAWYIEDDNPYFVPEVVTRSYIDKRSPRLEIEIQELNVPF